MMDEFGVTEETLRRRLDALEECGLLVEGEADREAFYEKGFDGLEIRLDHGLDVRLLSLDDDDVRRNND